MKIYQMKNGVVVDFNNIVFEGNKEDAKVFLRDSDLKNCYFDDIINMVFITTSKYGFLASDENPMK